MIVLGLLAILSASFDLEKVSKTFNWKLIELLKLLKLLKSRKSRKISKLAGKNVQLVRVDGGNGFL